MPLNDPEVRSAKPGAKPRKLSDGRGMYLLVQPNGARYWRMKYRFSGREKTLALGVYPEISLKVARERREEARHLLYTGIDPSEVRQDRKRVELAERDNTFKAVALEWFAKEKPGWKDSHSSKIESRLERDVYPYLGGRQVTEITAPDVLAVVRRVTDRGAVETAHRALQNIGQVMRYAIITGKATADPTIALRGALPAPKVKHHAAITEPKPLGQLLRDIEGYKGTHVVRCGLRMAPHVFLRPRELRRAEWSEIDLEAKTWAISAEKMKGSRPHVVPLSRQVVRIFEELEPLTGELQWVFPAARNTADPMSDNTLLAALRGLGYSKDQATPHGFRATARTLLDQELGAAPHLIEHQLAHTVRDPLGRAYNRTSHIRDRRQMMQKWSDYLDALRDGAKVIQFRRSARAKS